jgi:membrane protease YdiL (CAAX protease family)
LAVSVRRYQPLAEALALLLVTLPLAIGWHLPTLWFLTPLAVLTITKRSYATYGLSLERPGSVGFHVAVITAVFIPYAVGHYALAHWWYGATFHFRVPPFFLRSAVDQFLIIALPEEFFFRGYLQTQCDRIWGRPYRLLGAEWGIGLPLAAAVFAVCHVLFGGPVRLIVFFPGLLYGWLRARTATIVVPASYHAVSNLIMQLMLASLSV